MRMKDTQNGRHDRRIEQKPLGTRIDEGRRRGCASLFASLVIGATIWLDGGVAVAESSFAARDAMTKGMVELGGTVGYAQATTALGNASSANRSAVFIMPRVGVVLTDPLGTGLWQGNIELVVQPVFARFTKPFAAEAAGGSFLFKYNFLF